MSLNERLFLAQNFLLLRDLQGMYSEGVTLMVGCLQREISVSYILCAQHSLLILLIWIFSFFCPFSFLTSFFICFFVFFTFGTRFI